MESDNKKTPRVMVSEGRTICHAVNVILTYYNFRWNIYLGVKNLKLIKTIFYYK